MLRKRLKITVGTGFLILIALSFIASHLVDDEVTILEWEENWDWNRSQAVSYFGNSLQRKQTMMFDNPLEARKIFEVDITSNAYWNFDADRLDSVKITYSPRGVIENTTHLSFLLRILYHYIEPGYDPITIMNIDGDITAMNVPEVSYKDLYKAHFTAYFPNRIIMKRKNNGIQIIFERPDDDEHTI